MTRDPIDLPDPEPARPTIWAAREVRHEEPDEGGIIGPVIIVATMFWAAVAVVVFG